MMTKSCNTKDIKVGSKVRFKYYGGSDYGHDRTVKVVAVYPNYFDGSTDERDGEIRRYNFSSMSYSFEILVEDNANEKRVRFDEAGTALLASLPGDQLAELYAKYVALEGKSAKFDESTGEVVVELPEVKTNKYVKATSNNGAAIENKRGKIFRLWIYEGYNNPIGIENLESGLSTSEATPEQLRDELTKFLA